MTDLPAAVAETHSAVVFFFGDRAYKVKKPLDLGFLDFRRREAREAICHREVELNRRLAPDVYLGVVDVVAPDGEMCDHLIAMRRMPVERRLSSLVASGAPVAQHLRDIARIVAAFHARAATSSEIADAARAPALMARWEANIVGMLPFYGTILDADTGERVARWARCYLAGRGPLFDHRIAAGKARDGHGDLLADDIFCLDDGPRILDCIEFDDHLRWGDTLADVAFLAMDLERLGHPDLATLFLAHYAELSADAWPASLAHHHIAYRAHVRAKVACVRHEQGDPAAADAARTHLQLAHDHLYAARVRLILVGGLPATGKSTLAAGLGDALGATVLRSDEVRKDLAGLGHYEHAPAPPGEGIYRAEMTADTYRELLARAHAALGFGETTILDASWQDVSWRNAAAGVADAAAAELVELRCTAPPAVAAARLRTRSAEGHDASDATEEVARAMAQSAQPWPSAMSLSTDAPARDVVIKALEAVRRSPSRVRA